MSAAEVVHSYRGGAFNSTRDDGDRCMNETTTGGTGRMSYQGGGSGSGNQSYATGGHSSSFSLGRGDGDCNRNFGPGPAWDKDFTEAGRNTIGGHGDQYISPEMQSTKNGTSFSMSRGSQLNSWTPPYDLNASPGSNHCQTPVTSSRPTKVLPKNYGMDGNLLWQSMNSPARKKGQQLLRVGQDREKMKDDLASVNSLVKGGSGILPGGTKGDRASDLGQWRSRSETNSSISRHQPGGAYSSPSLSGMASAPPRREINGNNNNVPISSTSNRVSQLISKAQSANAVLQSNMSEINNRLHDKVDSYTRPTASWNSFGGTAVHGTSTSVGQVEIERRMNNEKKMKQEMYRSALERQIEQKQKQFVEEERKSNTHPLGPNYEQSEPDYWQSSTSSLEKRANGPANIPRHLVENPKVSHYKVPVPQDRATQALTNLQNSRISPDLFHPKNANVNIPGGGNPIPLEQQRLIPAAPHPSVNDFRGNDSNPWARNYNDIPEQEPHPNQSRILRNPLPSSSSLMQNMARPSPQQRPPAPFYPPHQGPQGMIQPQQHPSYPPPPQPVQPIMYPTPFPSQPQPPYVYPAYPQPMYQQPMVPPRYPPPPRYGYYHHHHPSYQGQPQPSPPMQPPYSDSNQFPPQWQSPPARAMMADRMRTGAGEAQPEQRHSHPTFSEELIGERASMLERQMHQEQSSSLANNNTTTSWNNSPSSSNSNSPSSLRPSPSVYSDIDKLKNFVEEKLAGGNVDFEELRVSVLGRPYNWRRTTDDMEADLKPIKDMIHRAELAEQIRLKQRHKAIQEEKDREEEERLEMKIIEFEEIQREREILAEQKKREWEKTRIHNKKIVSQNLEESNFSNNYPEEYPSHPEHSLTRKIQNPSQRFLHPPPNNNREKEQRERDDYSYEKYISKHDLHRPPSPPVPAVLASTRSSDDTLKSKLDKELFTRPRLSPSILRTAASNHSSSKQNPPPNTTRRDQVEIKLRQKFSNPNF